jgi:lipopolysaccharide assembly outer membrane protein LptD (OstA)
LGGTSAVFSVIRIPTHEERSRLLHLKGNVQIATKIVAQDAPLSLMIMVVRADEADYHEDTGEIEARGSVQVNYRDDPGGTKAGSVRIELERTNRLP